MRAAPLCHDDVIEPQNIRNQEMSVVWLQVHKESDYLHLGFGHNSATAHLPAVVD
jgi:hypothetical protein